MSATVPGDVAPDEFEGHRPHLLGIAYRVTGSRTVADDVVQEAWLRWQRTDRTSIERPAAWLTTVTSRLALDQLKSAQHRRETYVGPWLPEIANAEPGPEERAELAESLTVGFLAVLERLNPTERVVFLLADVFSVPYAEIAPVVDRSVEACRQVASRARARVREDRPRYTATDAEAWDVATAFLSAAQAGDLDSLVHLVAADALAVSDGGRDHRAARLPVRADRIGRFVVNLAKRIPADAEIEVRLLNGQPGMVLRHRGQAYQAVVIGVADGQVQRLMTIRNPEKLRALDADPIA